MGHSMLRLRFAIDGEERLFPLTGGRVRLGRGSENDVVLADVSVSRHHAEIRRGPDGWTIHDLKSTNGVEINRVSVRSAPLHAGDRVTIGAFDLDVESVLPAASAEAERGAFPGAGRGVSSQAEREASPEGAPALRDEEGLPAGAIPGLM